MEPGGSMESGVGISSTKLEASVTGTMVGAATASAKERAAVSAEDCTTVNAEARATVKAEDHATVNAENRATVNAEARTTVKAKACSAVTAEDRSALIVEAPTTVKAEDRKTVSAEDCSAVSAEARATANTETHSAVSAEDCSSVIVEAPTTVKAEGRAAVNAGNRATSNATDHATVNAEARAAVNAGACATVNADDRATAIVEAPTTVKPERRAAVNAEARATVSGGGRATVNGENRAVIVETPTTVKPEHCAAINVEARATVSGRGRATAHGEDCATIKAEDLATANAEERTTVNAGDRATVNAEARASVIVNARTTAKAEDHLAVNAEARATADAEDRATVNAEHRATVKVEARARFNAEDRAIFIAEDRTTINADDRATVKVDGRATVNAEDGATANAEDSAAFAAASLARSRGLCRVLDGARKERRKDARALARLDPARNAWEIARRNSQKLHAAKMKRRVSDQVAAIDKELNVCRISLLHGVCAAGVRAAAARQQEKGRLARREDAPVVARMGPQETLREVCKRNRARRIAVRVFHRRPERSATVTAMDVMASRILRGLESAEYSQEGIRARRELSRALTEMDAQERAREIARMFRANRVAACVIQRHRRNILARERAKCSAMLTREHALRSRNAYAAAVEAEASWAGGVNNTMHVTADEASATSETHKKLQTEGTAPKDGTGAGRIGLQAGGTELGDGVGAGEVELQTGGTDLVGGVGSGEVELQPGGIARLDGVGAGEVELQPDGTGTDGKTAVVDGIGTGEVDGKTAVVDGIGTGEVNGKAAVVDGIGAGEVELQPGGQARLDGVGAGRVELQVGGTELVDGIGADEVELQTGGTHLVAGVGSGVVKPQPGGQALLDGIGAGEVELPPDGVARLVGIETDGKTAVVDGVETGEADGKAAAVDGIGAGGFPLVEEVNLDEMRSKVIAEAAARTVRYAVEFNRKIDLARARHAEKTRRRAEKQERLDRRAWRDEKRRKKLQDRESRAKRKGERLRPPVEGMEDPARLGRDVVVEEGGGVLAHHDVQGGVHSAARKHATDEAIATSAKKRKVQDAAQALLDGVRAREVEPRRDGIAIMDGMGTDGMDHRAEVVEGSGSGADEFPFVNAQQEEIRAKAVFDVAERVARDAVEVKRKADLARARHAEKARRHAKRQEKMERRASREAKRLKKRQDQESRAHSQPGDAVGNETSEEESEHAEEVTEEIPEEVLFRGGKRRGLAVVGGGSSGGEGGDSADGAAGANNVPAYDYTEQATRFESSFAEADTGNATNAVPVTILPNKASFEKWLGHQTSETISRIKSLGHDSHEAARVIMVRSAGTEGGGDGALTEVAFCTGEGEHSLRFPFSLCSLREKLPAGTYALRGSNGDLPKPDAAALSWALGSYSFDRYKRNSGSDANAEAGVEKGEAEGGGTKEASEASVEDVVEEKLLAWPGGGDKRKVSATAASMFLVRDLISTQSEDMGPQHLEDVMASLSKDFRGNVRIVKGDDLLKEGDSYPMIHAIGCAAVAGREPRLLDLTWTPPNSEGNPNLRKVTLVGKGVCFDTEALDPKPAAGTLAMKKDMGGGAQVLGLARMIMAQELPVRLRVLVPAVEVAIGGDAEFKPGCVLVARDGKKSKVADTENAEGLLVLADALVEASSESPDLIVDCATLTGAARVALATEVSAFFCKDEEVAAKMHSLSGLVFDQAWRRPLWDGYPKQLSSKVVRLRTTGGGYGGAVSAALYLNEFVGKKACAGSQEGGSTGGGGSGQKLPWIHMDFLGFNPASRPGRPEGGEAQGMRALYELLEDMFGA